MNFIQQPSPLSFGANLKNIIVSGIHERTMVQLSVEGDILLNEYYYPVNSQISIDIRDVIMEDLDTFIPTSNELVSIQPALVKKFTLSIAGEDFSFNAIGGGLDSLSEDASGFLERNFLTANKAKRIDRNTPEFVSFFTQEECLLKLLVVSESGEFEFSVDLNHSTCYTFNLSPSFLSAHFNISGIISISAWIESFSGYHLADIYYHVDDCIDNNEKYLFINSLGGIDTLLCTGQFSYSRSVKNKLLTSGRRNIEGDQKLSVLYKQNTGFLGSDGVKIAVDFISSEHKYHFYNNLLIPIIIEEQESEYIRHDLNFIEFEYQYAEQSRCMRIAPPSPLISQLPPFPEKIAACFDKKVGNKIIDRTTGVFATISVDNLSITFPKLLQDAMNKGNTSFWLQDIVGSGRTWHISELTGLFTINYTTDECSRVLFFRDVSDKITSVLPIIIYKCPLDNSEVDTVIQYLKESYFLYDGDDDTLLVDNIPVENENIYLIDNIKIKI